MAPTEPESDVTGSGPDEKVQMRERGHPRTRSESLPQSGGGQAKDMLAVSASSESSMDSESIRSITTTHEQANDEDVGGEDLRTFRISFGSADDASVFPDECAGMSDVALAGYIHLLKAAVLDAPVADVMCELFALRPDQQGSAAERHAACWERLDIEEDVEALYAFVEKRTVCAVGKVFTLVAEVEERKGHGVEVYIDTLFSAFARIFSLREAVCTVLESRIPKKVRDNLPRLTMRLSAGGGELTEYQRLALILANKWTTLKLRKGGNGDDGVYARVLTRDGYDTHCWERLMSVEEWITKQTDTGNPMVWKMSTKDNGTKKRLVEHIVGSSSFDFAVKPKDRHVFSFTNGIYQTQSDSFSPYPAKDIDDDVGSCRYFDKIAMNPDLFEDGEFQGDYESGDWFDIPTEAVTKVLNDQDFSEDIQRAFWALGVGRMLYDLKELEKFEVMVFFKGIGGSGKSTLVRIVDLIYGVDAGVLSNNVEPLFGLSQHKNKYCIYAYELNEKFALEQAEWCSLVSGEMMSLAQKYKDALTQEWKSPYLAAGNRMFCRGDNASQIIRRLILFPFDKKPAQDTTLDSRIAANVANILVKGNRAYRKLVEFVGSRCIHDCLPGKFAKWRAHAQESSNPLITFLNTVSWVEKGEGFYCPWELFQRRFNEWLRQRDPRTRVVFDEDFYKHVFTENDIQLVLERATKFYPRGTDNKKRCFFLYGVDVGDENGDVHEFPAGPERTCEA